MSAPSQLPLGSHAATPNPPVRTTRPTDIKTILGNIPNLINLEATGSLGEPEKRNVRKLLLNQAKNIIAAAFRINKPHWLRNLPTSLDPTEPFGADSEILASKEVYDKVLTEFELAAVDKCGQDRAVLIPLSAKGALTMPIRPLSAGPRSSTPGAASTTANGGSTPSAMSTAPSETTTVVSRPGSAQGRTNVSGAAVTTGNVSAAPSEGTSPQSAISGPGTAAPSPSPAQNPPTSAITSSAIPPSATGPPTGTGVSAPRAGQPAGTPASGMNGPPKSGFTTNQLAQAGLFNVTEMKAIAQMAPAERSARFESNSFELERFQRSVRFWGAGKDGKGPSAERLKEFQKGYDELQKLRGQNGSAPPPFRPLNPSSSAGPTTTTPLNTNGNQPRPSISNTNQTPGSQQPHPQGNQPPPMNFAGALPPPGMNLTLPQQYRSNPMVVRPPPPAPIPEEPIAVRRKRKYKEYLKEACPGLEMEVDITNVLNEVLDSFVGEVARGGMRLAKHRKGDKVEVRDMAFYLDKSYGMTVPGFDALVSDRLHVPSEEKKRGKTINPKMATRAAIANAIAQSKEEGEGSGQT